LRFGDWVSFAIWTLQIIVTGVLALAAIHRGGGGWFAVGLCAYVLVGLAVSVWWAVDLLRGPKRRRRRRRERTGQV
jgi:hypothetical protein